MVDAIQIAGGLIATNNRDTVTGCFWDMETSVQASSGGGTGMTTAEMKNRATFSDAGWDFDDVWLIVEHVTYPLLQWQDGGVPAAYAGPDITVDEDTDVMLNGASSSDDIGIVSYEWTFNDGHPTTLHGALITYLFEDPGVFVVTLNVTDGAGNWDTDELTVTVRDVTPPMADAGPDQFVDQGTLVTFDGSGSLDNEAVVNFTWTLQDGAPEILHSVSPTYRFDTPGMYKVTLNVTDAAGNWAIDTMIVTVTDVTPPIAEAGPDLTVDEDTLVSFDGSLSNDYVGIVNWTWSFVDGESITLWGVQPTHRFEAPGTFVVTLQVSDAEGNVAIDIVTIIVTDVNNPPVIVSDVSESLDALEDEIFTLDLSADDTDGDVLTWSDNTDLFDIDSETGSISFVPVQDDVGIHNVAITVDDGNGGTDVLTFILEVIEVNDPPEIASDQPPSVDVFEDQSYNFYILGTDEEDRFVTWSDDTDLFDISPKWGTITFTPTQSEVGEWWVNITAEDSEGLTDQVLIRFTVQNVNDAPVITSISPTNGTKFKEGKMITFTVEATDEDGDDLTVTWTSDGVTLGTGPTLDYKKLKPGTRTIKVTVSDGVYTVEDEFTVVITKEEESPALGGVFVLLAMLVGVAASMMRRKGESDCLD